MKVALEKKRSLKQISAAPTFVPRAYSVVWVQCLRPKWPCGRVVADFGESGCLFFFFFRASRSSVVVTGATTAAAQQQNQLIVPTLTLPSFC